MIPAAAVAAIAAAAAIAVIALAFAVFAAFKPYVGPAGASAIVAGVSALAIGLVGWITAARARRRPRGRGGREEEDPTGGLAERLLDLAADRPLAAVSVAAALGLFLVRSPKSLGAVARAFFDTLISRVRPG